MFTDRRHIISELNKIGIQPTLLTYIPRGVMTDKYSFLHQGRKYIIRCFQPYRKEQPALEYKYLRLFQEKGIKAPIPYAFSDSEGLPYIVYEMLEGETLSDCFDSLDSCSRNRLCNDIAANYLKIADIKGIGYGKIEEYGVFSDTTWKDFIDNVITQAQDISVKNGNKEMADCCTRLEEFANGIPEPEPCLIWSDFSSDNIIVDRHGRLSGFIDFEGLMSGDPILGLGYLNAHEENDNLVSSISKALYVSRNSELIGFYSLIRLCRLLPYQHMPLPNGTEREPLSEFLRPAYRLISSFGK